MMFRAFADVQTPDMLNLPRPKLKGGKPQTIACPMSHQQKELQDELGKHSVNRFVMGSAVPARTLLSARPTVRRRPWHSG
jgi:hypothetical protein